MSHESFRTTHGRTVAARVAVALSDFHVRFRTPLTWTDLGDMLGWSQPTRSEVSTGKRPLQVHELVLIGMRLGVNVGWLAANEGEMHSGRPPQLPEKPKAPVLQGRLVARRKTPEKVKKVSNQKRT